MSGTTLDPESEFIKRETVGIFLEAVLKLSGDNAYILRLYIEGFDEDMIAEFFGISKMAVKSRLNRTREEIANYVKRKTERSDFGGRPIFKEDRMGLL